MKTLHALGKILFERVGFCAHIGAIVGIIAGLFFGLLQLLHPGFTLHWPDIVKTGLLLAVAGWLAVLIIVGIWHNYGLLAIALQALVNAIITSLLTVYVNNIIQLPVLAVLIGMTVGIIVGTVLCWLCKYYEKHYAYNKQEASP